MVPRWRPLSVTKNLYHRVGSQDGGLCQSQRTYIIECSPKMAASVSPKKLISWNVVPRWWPLSVPKNLYHGMYSQDGGLCQFQRTYIIECGPKMAASVSPKELMLSQNVVPRWRPLSALKNLCHRMWSQDGGLCQPQRTYIMECSPKMVASVSPKELISWNVVPRWWPLSVPKNLYHRMWSQDGGLCQPQRTYDVTECGPKMAASVSPKELMSQNVVPRWRPLSAPKNLYHRMWSQDGGLCQSQRTYIMECSPKMVANNPWGGFKVKVNWVGTLFSAPEVPISCSLVVGPDYSIYTAFVRGLPVHAQQALLPSQPKPIPIYTAGSRGAS